MSDDALKECPHCGSPAQLEDCRTIWRAICTSAACGALVLGDRAPEPEDGDEYPAGYWEAFEKSAIDRWNARPAIAPPVAAESVDTEEFSALAARYGNSKAGKDYMALVANAAAWGAQQREAGRHDGALVSLNNYDAACDEYRKQIAALTRRAEKAEAEADILFHRLNAANGHRKIAEEELASWVHTNRIDELQRSLAAAEARVNALEAARR